MITLGIDSSEAEGGVALIRDGMVLGEERFSERLRHSEELLPAVNRLTDSCGIGLDEIARVCVNRGPGSFTGLRIGLATAMGFSQARGIPVTGVDGTLAYRARVKAHRVCVIIVNRRDLFYARWFSGERASGDVEVVTRDDIVSRLSAERRGIVVVGSGAEALRDELSSLPAVEVAPPEANRVSSVWIARLGEEKGDENELLTLEPLYVEPAIRTKTER